jgi:protein CpxP
MHQKISIMKNIKLILAITFFSFAFAGSINAQTTEQTEKATKQTERLSTELSLTEEQKTQAQQINLGIILKNDAIRSAENMSQEEKTIAISSNNDARKEMFRGILTAEQFTKFEQVSVTRPIKSEMRKLEMPAEQKVKN